MIIHKDLLLLLKKDIDLLHIYFEGQQATFKIKTKGWSKNGNDQKQKAMVAIDCVPVIGRNAGTNSGKCSYPGDDRNRGRPSRKMVAL